MKIMLIMSSLQAPLRMRRLKKKESNGKAMRGQEDLVEELPFNGHDSDGFIGKLIKCATGKVNGIAVVASRARVCNSNDNRFAVRGIVDLNLLAAKTRPDASVTVTFDIHSADKIGVLVHCATGSGDSVLVKECCKSS
jgi:hypothetical protein